MLSSAAGSITNATRPGEAPGYGANGLWSPEGPRRVARVLRAPSVLFMPWGSFSVFFVPSPCTGGQHLGAAPRHSPNSHEQNRHPSLNKRRGYASPDRGDAFGRVRVHDVRRHTHPVVTLCHGNIHMCGAAPAILHLYVACPQVSNRPPLARCQQITLLFGSHHDTALRSCRCLSKTLAKDARCQHAPQRNLIH